MMTGREFERASREWQNEVDTEAAELVRGGTPPIDAVIQARDNVSRRRRRAASLDPADAAAFAKRFGGGR